MNRSRSRMTMNRSRINESTVSRATHLGSKRGNLRDFAKAEQYNLRAHTRKSNLPMAGLAKETPTAAFSRPRKSNATAVHPGGIPAVKSSAYATNQETPHRPNASSKQHLTASRARLEDRDASMHFEDLVVDPLFQMDDGYEPTVKSGKKHNESYSGAKNQTMGNIGPTISVVSARLNR